MTRVAGVDGVGPRWLTALVTATGEVGWALCDDAAGVLAATTGCAAVAVDVPMGLPADGYRESEVLAKRRLGPARASIFYTPVRAVLDCDSYEEACAVSRELTGKAISRQTWGLVAKVRDWDRAPPPAHVVEAHPELCFRAMAPDVAFAGKRTARGAAQRMAALGRRLAVPDVLETVPDGAPLEDALDALACAWTARRVAAGVHERLGDEVDTVTGRPMSIVF